MIKKFKKLSEDRSLAESQLATAVKESAQQIWLAGLGAFSKAQEEGQKVFEALVKEGVSLQKKTKEIAEDTVSEATGKMNKVASGLANQASETWDKLETVFEDRVARALNRLGVPSKREIEALAAELETLKQKLAAKTTAVKTAVKTTPSSSKKTASKTVKKTVKK
ncbi:MAG: phasin family protein [Burkholderiaceae bacterium]|nr:phasin family protein [Burkholderiaceae bacterium]